MKFLALIGVGLIFTLAACGGSGSDQATDRSNVASAEVTQESGEASQSKDRKAKTQSQQSRPQAVKLSKAEIEKLPPLAISKPSGPPPRRFEITDLRKGSGPALTKADAVVSLRYIEDTYPEALKGKQGALSEGVAVRSDWEFNKTSRTFWRGLPGMKVGGRRELIVPPKVAYPRWRPSWGYAPYVSIYVVDLLGLESGR